MSTLRYRFYNPKSGHRYTPAEGAAPLTKKQYDDQCKGRGSKFMALEEGKKTVVLIEPYYESEN